MASGSGKTRTPRVAVIVPCYNSGWSIERTMRSLFAQTFADFEVVIVNDGSTDDSLSALEHFAHDPRLRIVHQPNRGLAAARNRGIRETSAPFVAPLDADDLWHPEYLSTLVRALDSQPDAPFAYADSWRIDEQDKILPFPPLPSDVRHDFIGLLSVNTVGSGSAAIFRRSCLPEHQPYDESLRARAAQGAEDWKLILTLARTAKPIFCPFQLVAYRVTGTSMSRALPKQQLASGLTALADVRRENADVDNRWFRDARTMLTAWTLLASLRRRRFDSALGAAIIAYGGNPLFWLNANVRMMHVARARVAIAALFRRASAQRVPLRDLIIEGHRPFAFLEGERR